MSKHPTSQRLADFLPYQLSIASNAVSSRIAEQYRRRFALKTTEWRIMAVLGDSGPLTQRDLSQITLMDKVPVNRACKTLEDRGLAARQPNAADGRSHLLELTAEGRAVHARIMPLALDIERELFSALDQDEREQLKSMLLRLREAAGEFDAEALEG
ncbi:MarR family transcriptional regulator [Qipengyuania pelagi]|jgi:DNA-binding MarR family transcriptional regulator|uniref:MarR family transcriptional regulator n=1 Tax=Qipengyuania pelagi TaxID=994320 RepID=A0A844Y7Y2_9SPHN|nr:MarR family winged helix-turn-helix transcriptional regulator [Qipengyuania pelagi]MEC7818576.1 MarR family winged helix-turn-helix transcriptional regulator [Pseudomonadota bacterium]MXO54051.1 MarR family transcriptional regulator [Qipengyuania pelagi]